MLFFKLIVGVGLLLSETDIGALVLRELGFDSDVHAVLIEVLERCARDRPGCFSRSGPAVRAQEGAGRQAQGGA